MRGRTADAIKQVGRPDTSQAAEWPEVRYFLSPDGDAHPDGLTVDLPIGAEFGKVKDRIASELRAVDHSHSNHEISVRKIKRPGSLIPDWAVSIHCYPPFPESFPETREEMDGLPFVSGVLMPIDRGAAESTLEELHKDFRRRHPEWEGREIPL